MLLTPFTLDKKNIFKALASGTSTLGKTLSSRVRIPPPMATGVNGGKKKAFEKLINWLSS